MVDTQVKYIEASYSNDRNIKYLMERAEPDSKLIVKYS